MSLAYAEALTYREDLGGQVGAPELFDAPESLHRKISELVDLIAAAREEGAAQAAPAPPPAPLVVFTGAGLSTAAGIPDFRGPDGVWTRQRDGRPPPTMMSEAGGGGGGGGPAAAAASFSTARPTYAHAALAALTRAGLVGLVVSQNVDGLHLRAGQPRTALAELHGNVFAEACARPACGVRYVRGYETGSVGRRATPRRCAACGGRLRDDVLDWEQALPEADLQAAEAASSGARLALTLGTSLQIVPACELPLRTVASGGRLAIVNLQATPKDGRAALVVRGRCDEVMRGVMAGLAGRGLVPRSLPDWVRTDRVVVVGRLSSSAANPKRAKGGSGGGGGGGGGGKKKGTATIALESPDGGGDCFPVVAMVAGMDVWVDDDDDDEGGGGGGETGGREPDVRLDAPPWRVRVPVVVAAARGGGGGGGAVRVRVRIVQAPAADPGVEAPVVDFTLGSDALEFRETVEWESQRVVW